MAWRRPRIKGERADNVPATGEKSVTINELGHLAGAGAALTGAGADFKNRPSFLESLQRLETGG